jgi:hypothetical protein
MPDKKPEIWEAQEWVRVAPIDEVREFLGWARAVLDMRCAQLEQPKRKKRSDAGQKREDGQQPIDLKEITK